MKRITLLFIFMWTVLGQAQLKDYTFSPTAGSFTEITTQGGATTLGDATATNQFYVNPAVPAGGTETTGSGFAIGFSFTFDGNAFDKFGVSNEGWISLGKSAASPSVDMRVSSNSLPLSSNGTTNIQTDNLCATIAAFSNDLAAQPGASLSFQTIGTAPNRTLVVQWKNYKRSLVASGDSFDFQIRLNETTNTIQFVYGAFQVSSTITNFQVGLRSAPASTANNFAILKSTTGWSNPPLGTLTADRMRLDDVNYPKPSGLTYTWSPPTCGSVKNLLVSNITDKSAILNWGSNIPTPSGFEYVVSASNVLPTSGTATTATTANITGLSSNTKYYVFTRTTCTSTPASQWQLTGDFTTLCPEVTSLMEDFDSYANSVMPDCWARANSLNASCYVTSGSVLPASAPKRFYIASGSVGNVAHAILPTMSNISTGTHRLRFKAYAEVGQAGRTLEVGYFLNSNDVTTFQPLQPSQPKIDLPVGPSEATEFIFSSAGVPSGIKNLVIRNSGIPLSSTSAYVDDIIWEPIPGCPDVTSVVAKSLTSSSATITWSAGTTTKWQYAYALPSVKDPYTLAGIDVPGTNPTVQINSLSPSTVYKVWVRSSCNTSSFGAWIGPIVFETTCASVSVLSESFDAGSAVPVCWRKVGNTGALSTSAATSPLPPSSPNVLAIYGDDASKFTVVAMPPLTTAQAGTHQLRLKIRGSVAGIGLEVGYLTDVSNASTFTYLQTIPTEMVYTSKLIKLGSAPQSAYLAFRNPGSPAGAVFIDNVVWEPIPTCSDLKEITASVDSNSVSLHWKTDGAETQWEYVLGNASDMNPFVLNALPITNPVTDLTGIKSVITGLSNNTAYKLWMRSKCADGSVGSWSDPINLMTSCAPGTEFSQSFDAAASIPSCWARSGNTGISVTVGGGLQGGINPPSAPYALKLEANAAGSNGPAVVAMPAMSNTAAGTHRLTFKYRSENGLGSVEVGYLLNIADSGSFKPLGTPFACTSSFQVGTIEFGTDVGSQILAFRNNGNPHCIVTIDDVVWAPIPPCNTVSNLKVSSVGHNTIDFNWTKGGTETEWQFAVGTATESNPNGLTHYDVTGLPVAQAFALSPSVPLVPSTTYKIWVRAKCSDSFSNWSDAISAKTTCAPTASFTENFSASTTIPDCWTRVGNKGDVKIDTYFKEVADGNKLYMFNGSPADAAIIAMPPLSNAGTGDHVLKFRFVSPQAGTKLQVGYIGNVLDPASFTLIDTYTTTSDQASDVITLNLGTSPTSNIIAFKHPGITSASILIDDVSWLLVPTGPPACVTTMYATTDPTCGNYATVISWAAVATADGYLVDVSTSPTTGFLVKDQKVAGQSYSFIGNYGATYYYTVRAYNSIGEAHGCTQQSFTTKSNGCYCISEPAANDNSGIFKVQVGAAEFINSDVTYNDFSAKPVNIGRGLDPNLKITFATFYPYNTQVYIDFNNDFKFDEGEMVFTGVSEIGNLSVLNAPISISQAAQLGMHKMRIVTWPGTASLGSPCYNGAYGVTLDFNVNVVDLIANDNPSTAIELAVGTDFAQKVFLGNNVNATGSTKEPAPGCGNYNGADVWYKAVVPASGKLTFEVNTATGGLTNTAAAVYSGQPDNLTLVSCDDSSSLAGDNQPKISLTGKNTGDTFYLRVWENGGDDYGVFNVSAYDGAGLGVDTFEMNNFSYHPNPVKDILNISLDQEISDVVVMNMLGQQVIAKTVNANRTQIDMSGLSKGTYLIKITADNQSKTVKAVKE